MITITNGRDTLKVTPGAFRDIFKAQGFKEISETPTYTNRNTPKIDANSGVVVLGEDSESSTEAISDMKYDESEPEVKTPLSRKDELAEIPLNEMSPNELREYAKLLGVDIRGLKSKSAVKDKIRSVL